jgi:hypothetical protein
MEITQEMWDEAFKHVKGVVMERDVKKRAAEHIENVYDKARRFDLVPYLSESLYKEMTELE